MPRLGVNIDHVATLRQARGGHEPDPVWAAVLAELGGADGITIHLREDRRHIQDRDLRLLRETVRVRLNLEMAVSPEIVSIAIATKPHQVTLVPERRQEVTTEGGLNILLQYDRVREAVQRCKDAGIEVSLFIDPNPEQVEASFRSGAEAIELHTGRYADASSVREMTQELDALKLAGEVAIGLGLGFHAGHGLNYSNVRPVACLIGMRELNIGHAIVSRAVFVGMERAVREMKTCLTHRESGEIV
jgi:pyridoxine 5-phosphate synthase